MDRFVLISFVIMDYLSLSLRFDNILASATTAFIADGPSGTGPPIAIATSPYPYRFAHFMVMAGVVSIQVLLGSDDEGEHRIVTTL